MDDLQLPKLRELAAPAVVMSPLARIRLFAVRGVPAVGPIQDPSPHPLKQAQTAPPLHAPEPARATSPSSESTVSNLIGACSLGTSKTAACSETRAVTNG